MAKITIVIPTLGLQTYLQLCVASVLMHTRKEDYDIVVINNVDPEAKGVFCPLSPTDLIDAMEHFETIDRKIEVHFISSGENHGFAKSCNRGAKRAFDKKSDFIVFLNNDCVVHPGWLDAMIRTYESQSKTGVVGVWSNYVGGIQNVFVGHAQLQKPHWGIQLVKGVCILVNAERFWEVGGFDEEYSKKGWYTDDDLCMKMIGKGYYNAIAPTFVTHFGSKTFEAMGVDLVNDAEIKADKIKFMQKWEKALKRMVVIGPEDVK